MVIFGTFLAAMRPRAFRDLRTNTPGLHLLRSLLSLLVLYAYFYAISRIELATAVLFLSTSPIFVPLVALLFMGYRSAATVWLGVSLAFLGVGIIVNPDLGASLADPSYAGLASGMLSGALGGAATVVIWRMSRTEPPDRQMVFFTVASFVFSIPLAVWQWEIPQPRTFLPIVLLGIATTLAQFYLSKGCQVAPADKINTWNYLSIVIAALAAFVGWNESLRPATIAGMVLVVIGAHVASRTHVARRLRKTASQDEHNATYRASILPCDSLILGDIILPVADGRW